MRRVPRALAVLAALAVLGPVAVAAQTIGTFSWQMQPFCNVLTLTATQVGGTYRLEGTDNECGSGSPASALGMAFPNANGSISFGLTIVTPSGVPAHVRATISLNTLGGTWVDGYGNSGTFAFNASTGGPPRPGVQTGGAGFGVTLTQQPGQSDRAITASVTVDNGARQYDAAAIYGQYGAFSSWGAPGNAGVRGDSSDSNGVIGTTLSGTGVGGYAGQGTGVTGFTVEGKGVVAQTLNGTTALEVVNGSVKVVGPVTPVFVHTTSVANLSANATVIDHPFTNNDPSAMLFVTHDYGPLGPYQTSPFGVFYFPSLGKWTIYNENLTAMPVGLRFNVLVVKR